MDASIEDVDEVIERLEHIVDQARVERSRVGYFAAMYCAVTRAIKKAIEDERFENGPRMAKFDWIFANRYIEAYDEHRSGDRPSKSWQASFDGAAKWRPIIVQQLLTGMNAHINLDLGIAAARVAPGDELAGLHADFNTINEVLAEMTERFMKDVESVSPWIKVLDRIGGRTERHIIKFSIDVARDSAWQLAEKLAPLDAHAQTSAIRTHDEGVADFGRMILRPGWFLPIGLFVIRIRESNDVDKVIDVLSDP